MMKDLTFALRMLRKNPGFTAVAVLSLHPGSAGNRSRSVGGVTVRVRISDFGFRISNFVLGSVHSAPKGSLKSVFTKSEIRNPKWEMGNSK